MKKEIIAMSERELQRWRLIGLVDGGNIALKEASEKMGVYCRQAKRLRKREGDILTLLRQGYYKDWVLLNQISTQETPFL